MLTPKNVSHVLACLYLPTIPLSTILPLSSPSSGLPVPQQYSHLNFGYFCTPRVSSFDPVLCPQHLWTPEPSGLPTVWLFHFLINSWLLRTSASLCTPKLQPVLQESLGSLRKSSDHLPSSLVTFRITFWSFSSLRYSVLQHFLSPTSWSFWLYSQSHPDP